MKKFAMFFIVALCVLTLMSGCSKAPETSAPPTATSKVDTIQFSDNQLYAVAWVGYDDLTNLPYYLDSYVGAGNVPTHYFSEGDYYLVIPKYADMCLKLYKNDIATNTSALVFEEWGCKPFLVQCNFSDIFPDVTVSLTYENETVTFSPFLSLKDGSLEIGEKGLDLTKEDT